MGTTMQAYWKARYLVTAVAIALTASSPAAAQTTMLTLRLESAVVIKWHRLGADEVAAGPNGAAGERTDVAAQYLPGTVAAPGGGCASGSPERQPSPITVGMGTPSGPRSESQNPSQREALGFTLEDSRNAAGCRSITLPGHGIGVLVWNFPMQIAGAGQPAEIRLEVQTDHPDHTVLVVHTF